MQSLNLNLNFPNDKVVSILVRFEEVPCVTSRTNEIFAQLGCKVPKVVVELTNRVRNFEEIQRDLVDAKKNHVRDKVVSFAISTGLVALIALSILGFLEILPVVFFNLALILYSAMSGFTNSYFLKSKGAAFFSFLPPVSIGIPIYQTFKKVAHLTEKLNIQREEIQTVLQEGAFEISKFSHLNYKILNQKLNQHILDVDNAIKALQAIQFDLNYSVTLAEKSLQEHKADFLRVQLVLERFRHIALKIEYSKNI